MGAEKLAMAAHMTSAMTEGMAADPCRFGEDAMKRNLDSNGSRKSMGNNLWGDQKDCN